METTRHIVFDEWRYWLRSRLAINGALLFALAAGCPALIWGEADSQIRYHVENFMDTPLIYHTDIDPTVDSVATLLSSIKKMSGAE